MNLFVLSLTYVCIIQAKQRDSFDCSVALGYVALLIKETSVFIADFLGFHPMVYE